MIHSGTAPILSSILLTLPIRPTQKPTPGFYLALAHELRGGHSPASAYDRLCQFGLASLQRLGVSTAEVAYFQLLLRGDSAAWAPERIRSSGYVLHTLEAAVWCLLGHNTYAATVLAAVNLGEDTDTTAAVVGGLAGLYYGESSMPAEWLATLARRSDIEALAERMGARTSTLTTRSSPDAESRGSFIPATRSTP